MSGSEAAAAQPVKQQANFATTEGQKQKRHLRERQSTNYNEDFIEFDSIELDERPLKRSKFGHDRTIPSISASHLELETAWAVVVNAGESILDEEEDLLPAGAHEQVYVQVRNIVVSKWREDVSRYLSEKDAVAAVGWAHRPYAIAAWRFLHQTGFINYGVAPGVSGRQQPEQTPKGTVVVVGAGMAGLATARQLQAKGHRVIVVEGHGRPGGRVYSKKLEKGKVSAVADLGGSILTGIDGNPLAVIAKQLHIPLHVIDEANVPLYQDNGQQAHTLLDQEVEKRWNDVLDECSKYRDAMGEVTDNISLGTALESLWATAEALAPAVAKKRGRRKKTAVGPVTAEPGASEPLAAEAIPAASDAQTTSGTQLELESQAAEGFADVNPAQPATSQAAHNDVSESLQLLLNDGLQKGFAIEPHAAISDVVPSTTSHGTSSSGQHPDATDTPGQLDLPSSMQLDAAAAQPEELAGHNAKHNQNASAAADMHSRTAVELRQVDTANVDSDKSQVSSAADTAAAPQPKQPLPQLNKQASLDSHQTSLELSVLEPACTCSSEYHDEAHADCQLHSGRPVKPSSLHSTTPVIGKLSAPDSTQDMPSSIAAPTGAVLNGQRGGAVSRLPQPDVEQVAEPALLDGQHSAQLDSSQTGPSGQLTKDGSADIAAAVSDAAQVEAAEDVMNSPAMQKLKRQLLDWHMANLEFANAAMLGTLSMRSWDQDDPFEIQGSHCFLPGCNIRLVQALAKGLPIMYNNVVKRISYDQSGVQVTAGNTVIAADAVVVTVPLGVLKKDDIKFEPALPERKLQAIRRLGFGVLNKVVLLFEEDFWGSTDMFGRLAPSTTERGKFFLFYSYTGISGGPLLAALVSGEAAEDIEKIPAHQAVAEALSVLRGIFEPKGILVPTPLQACCTRWGQDPMAYGSYSSVGVGSVGSEDYDVMAESLGERLFFAGEATTRKFPATMHGAFFSGLREAANVDATLTRLQHQLKRRRDAELAKANAVQPVKLEDGQDPDFKPEKLAAGLQAAEEVPHLAAQLSQVFENGDAPPDAEFGCFQIVYGPPDSEYAEEALLRLDVGSIRGRGAPRRSMPIFLSLSRANAQRLQDLPGGDEARVNFLTTTLGLQMVGRAGLTSPQKGLVKAVLAKRQAQQPLPGPPPRQFHNPMPPSSAHPQHAYTNPQHTNTFKAQQPAYAHQQPVRPQFDSKASAGYMRPQYSASGYHAPQYSAPANESWQSWKASAPAPAQQYPGYAKDTHAYTAQPYSHPYGQAGMIPDRVDPRRHTNAFHPRTSASSYQPAHLAWQAGNQIKGLAGQPHDRHSNNFGFGQYHQQYSGYHAGSADASLVNGHNSQHQ